MPAIKLLFLGPPQIHCNEKPVVLTRRRSIAVLAYLAATGHPCQRATLVDMFWPDRNPSNGLAALRTTLWELSRELGGEWRTADRKHVALSATHAADVDVLQFEKLRAQVAVASAPAATIPLLTKAAELYRGDFLQRFDVQDCPAFDDWQAEQSVRLRSEVLDVLKRLVDLHIAMGRTGFERAISWAKRLLALDPLAEAMHRQLMWIYDASRRRADAFKQYEICIRLLHEQLGEGPQAETVRLYKAIKASSSLATENNAPPAPGPAAANKPISKIGLAASSPAVTIRGTGRVTPSRYAAQLSTETGASMSRTFDIIIAGNGVLGYSTALALHEREPGLRIALIGPPARAGGATLAAGAMLGCFGEVTKTGLASEHGHAKLEMAIKASGLWPTWLAKINERAAGQKPAVVTPGTFVILNTKSGTLDTDNYEAIREALERHNQSWEDIRPESVPGLSPISGCRSLLAMHLPNEGSLDSSRLLENLALAVRRTERVTEIDGQVKALLAHAGRIEGVEMEGGESLGAGSVVLAAGAMSQRVLDAMPELAARIPRLFSGSGTSALLKPERPCGITGVIRTPNRAFACGLHVVPRADGDIYVGATNNIFLDPQERPNVYDMTFLLECLTQQVQEALHVAELVQWRTGNRPMTIDTYPLIGKTSINGLWLLTGTFRDGLHMSPLLAQHIAQELLGREGLFQNIFPPERRPFRTWKREQAIEETVRHYMAVGHEHSMKVPDGWHDYLDGMFRRKVIEIYADLGTEYVLPPEFITLLYRYPEMLPTLRTICTSLERQCTKEGR